VTKLENQKNVTSLSIHYMHKTKSVIHKGSVKIKCVCVLDNTYAGRVDMKRSAPDEPPDKSGNMKVVYKDISHAYYCCNTKL
jgi:hypothetical protein